MGDLDGITDLTGEGAPGDGAGTGDGAPPQDGLPASDPKDGVSKKIDKLTRKRREAERDAEAARAEAAYYKGLAEGAAASDPGTGNSGEGTGLDRLDYETDAAYHKALAKEAIDAERAKLAAEDAARKQATARAVAQKQYDAARKKYEDFDEVALGNSLPITASMFEAASGDNLTDVLYALGKDPAEAARIASLSPVAQAKEIGKIEAGLNPPKKKTPTDAPEPPNTVGGGGGNPPAKSEQELLDKGKRADLHAKWEKERRARLGVR